MTTQLWTYWRSHHSKFALAALTLWFLGPHLQWDGYAPLADVNARLIGLCLLALIWGWCNHSVSHGKQPKDGSTGKASSGVSLLWQQFSLGLEELKSHAALYRFGHLTAPCYLLLGSPGSGRHTLLQQAGVESIYPRKPQQDHANTLQWWQHHDTVFLLSEPHLDPEEADTHAGHDWPYLLQQLKRLRWRRPFDGIILSVDIMTLYPRPGHKAPQALTDLIPALTHIASTHKGLPIYLVLTQCDLIAGFQDFFADLDPDERTQYWGITRSQNLNQPTALLANYDEQFAELLKRLNDLLIRRIHQETNAQRRVLIKDFPVQMERIQGLLKQTLEHLTLPPQLQWQGIFFTSSKQTQHCYDFLLEGKEPKAIPTHMHQHDEQHARQVHYFSRQLFQDIAKLHTMRQQSKRQHWPLVATGLLALGISGGIGWQWYQHYELTRQTTALLQKQLHATASASTMSTDHTKALWEHLDRLATAQHILQQKQQGWHTLGLHQLKDLLARTTQRYHHVLSTTLLHALLAELEAAIQSPKTDLTQQYQALQTYLQLGNQLPGQDATIVNWFAQQWASQPAHHAKQHLQHVRHMLTLPHDKPKLNERLLKHQKYKLDQLDTAQRILLLTANQPHLASLPIDKQGELFKTPAFGLPELYTHEQFQTMMQQDIPHACKILAHHPLLHMDNDIPQDQCIAQSQALYIQRYAQTWIDHVAALHLQTIQDLAQAQQMLHQLSYADGVLEQALSLVMAQLRPVINHEQLRTEQRGHLDNLVTSMQALKNPELRQSLQNLAKQLNTIVQAKNPHQAAYELWMQPFRHKKQPDLIAQALKASASAPQPVRTWVESVIEATKQLLASYSRSYLNQVWQETVFAVYSQRLAGRYPLQKSASNDVSLSDFEAFFAPNGIMETYFNEYFSPMVNTSSMHWQWTGQAAALGIGSDVLNMFMRARLIQEMYFHHGKKLLVEFSLIPVELKSNVRELRINMGGHSLIVKPGDEHINPMRWPIGKDDNVSLQFINSAGQGPLKSVNSPWGWFRLIDTIGNIQPTQNGRKFQLSFTTEGYGANFDLIADQPLNPFIPDMLTTFSCPEQL